MMMSLPQPWLHASQYDDICQCDKIQDFDDEFDKS